MSTRAIAQVVGVSHVQVAEDQKAARVNYLTPDLPKVVGLDGKEYSRRKPPEAGRLTVQIEVTDAPEPRIASGTYVGGVKTVTNVATTESEVVRALARAIYNLDQVLRYRENGWRLSAEAREACQEGIAAVGEKLNQLIALEG